MAIHYLDFDLEIGKGRDGVYAIKASWQGNQAYHDAQPQWADDPANLRKQLEEAVLDSPLRRRRAFSTSEATVKNFGQKLFDFALGGEVLAQLRACQRTAKSRQQAGVRLRLRILDPELAGLPWEYLYDTQLRDFVALDPNMPLVRYPYHAYAAAPLSVTPPLRILAMVASPINLQILDIEREKQHVEQAVAALQQAGRIELVWLEGEGALDLQSALRKGPWHIFHFIGHGDFDLLRDEGYLVLCNPGNHQAEPLYATQLARLLSAQQHNLRFVLLNACESAHSSKIDIFSSTAETLINREIPAVLAMQYSITDDAATIFAQKLYESIAEGLPIDRSVAEARNALALADHQNLEWGVPVLHMRAPDGNFFDFTQLIPLHPPSTPTKTDHPPLEFDWVVIPAGEFLMGSDKQKDPDARDDELPQHRAVLSEYAIARVPVTNAQYKQFVDATNYAKPSHWTNGKIPAGLEDHPVVRVSWQDAVEFCQWAEVRLPTEAEWEKAARGTDGRIYPWGNEPPTADHANFSPSLFRIIVRSFQSAFQSATTPVGNYPLGASPYGLLDMAGNVWEFVSDWYDAGYYKNSPVENPRGPTSGSYHGGRGGCFSNSAEDVRVSYRDFRSSGVLEFGTLGFRVVRVVSFGS